MSLHLFEMNLLRFAPKIQSNVKNFIQIIGEHQRDKGAVWRDGGALILSGPTNQECKRYRAFVSSWMHGRSCYTCGPMSADPNLSRLSIYKGTPPSEKCRQESTDIFHLLWRLDKTIPFDDVVFGGDPPDFIFKIQGRDIGAELTDIDPKIFAGGGNRARGEFKKWEDKVREEKTGLEETFPWSSFTLGETLAAFENRLKTKQQDAATWKSQCSEKWLLMRVARGTALGGLLGGKNEVTLGMEEQVANYFAKAMHDLNAICKQAKPIDRVLIFHSVGIEHGGISLMTVSTGVENRYNLPEPSLDILGRGESASSEFLNWTQGTETTRRVKNIPLGKLHEHFRPKSQTKL